MGRCNDPKGQVDAPPNAPGLSRRNMLRGASAAALLGITPGVARAKDVPAANKPATMPMRPLGKTGVRVSLFGLGCFPLGKVTRVEDAIDIVHASVRAGCTYFDTAPSYSRGVSEERLGRALKALGRDASRLFIATKSNTRTADDTQRDLDQSLRRIDRTPIDMVQIHAIKSAEDMALALDPKRGPLRALLRAREQRLIRFIGVTGHADPRVMSETITRYGFDAVLFPLNCVDPHHMPFVTSTLPTAIKRGTGRIAMKVFASGRLPKRGKIDARACLRYTYGLDISTAIVGCSTTGEVALAASVARENKPMTKAERAALLAKTAPLKGKKTEWYKRA